jgi:long-chain acyl-CoA synthetase
MACLDDNTVIDFLEHLLAPERRSEVEIHIGTCDGCRRLVSRLALAAPSESRQDAGSADDDASTSIATDDVPAPRGPALDPGALVGRFEILRLIGRGGMGEVYLARDQQLGRRVALKCIHPDVGATADMIARLSHEARATARLSHPHIVTAFDVGEHQGKPYIALEYLEGETLDRRIARGRASAGEAMRLGQAVARALGAAHAAGVLHRDLKPHNIILANDGRLRVLDFGLAKLVGEDDPRSAPRGSRPRHTDVQGTPAYMAPEQWRGETATAATDVWALGVIMYELLSGSRPFTAADRNQLEALVTSSATAPRLAIDGLPAPLADICLRCLAKDPPARPTTAELDEAFAAMLNDARGFLGPDESPFRGLMSFREQDAHRYHGREEEVAALAQRLRDVPAVLLVAPSGAGKSSFLRAGIVPRLREIGYRVLVDLRPGAAPFDELAAALIRAGADSSPPVADQAELARELSARPARLRSLLLQLTEEAATHPNGPTGVLLLVDQLEELCTRTADRDEQRRFIDALSVAADDPAVPVRSICAARDDFLYRILDLAPGAGVPQYPGSAGLGPVTVLPRMTAADLERALIGPLEGTGYSYEDPALVGDIIAAVEGDIACLPLVQFTAQRLWDGRDRQRKLLTRDRYREIGGVAGALADHADGVIAGLAPDERSSCRALLLRLVSPSGTRRSQSRAAILDGLAPTAEALLDTLIAARLITPRDDDVGAPELELTHETLVTSWGTLARWLDESRAERRIMSDAEQAAALWERTGERAQHWEGALLDEARRAVAGDPSIVLMDDGLDAAACLARLRERNAVELSIAEVAPRVIGWSQAVAIGAARHTEEPAAFETTMRAVDLDRPGVMLYTSGTTGDPKGVPLSHKNVAHNGRDWLTLSGASIDERAVDLLWLPFSHIFGFGEACLGNTLGFTSYLCDPQSVIELLPEVRPSVLMSVPAIWDKLAKLATMEGEPDARRARLTALTGGRLRFCLSGGAGLSLATKELFYSAGVLIIEGYGLTECSPTLTLNRADAFRFDSVGKPLPSVELRLEEDGEILARGPNVFAGYHKDETATREAFTMDGWFKTGDIGRFTADGFLQIIDRKKDILVTAGGKNVAPGNIELYFAADPLIQHAVVYGDGKSYLTLALWLNPEGVDAKLAELGIHDGARDRAIADLIQERIDAVNARLARFEQIRKHRIMDVPLTIARGLLTSTLKIRRKAIYAAFRRELEELYQ